MRNILLWDKIMTQLHSGAYGPFLTYELPWTDMVAAGASDISDIEIPLGAERDPFLDLSVSWTELDHNLMLMVDEGVITADFTDQAIRNVRLTGKGRRMFEMRDEDQRLSQPVHHLGRQAGSVLSRIGFPLVALAVVAWMVLDAL